MPCGIHASVKSDLKCFKRIEGSDVIGESNAVPEILWRESELIRSGKEVASASHSHLFLNQGKAYALGLGKSRCSGRGAGHVAAERAHV